MGTPTMASQAGSRRQSPVQSLARQGSLYSLTLNEVQSHLGEPLHSMNLDDLLKNVYAAESPYLSMDVECNAAQYSAADRVLSKKTVDEVWRDIQQKSSDELSSSLGEMTLEDFLLKARVVVEGTQGPHWLHQYHQMSAVHQPHQPQAPRVTAANMSDRQVPQPLMGTLSDPQTPGRKRGCREDVGEKTVERRQKRMIKNRESAARSRARKQAYTNELENKVSRLEEENETLRKQKEFDTILHSAPPPEPKHRLRRSSSSPF